MRLLLQGHLDLPQRVTLDVVLKDPYRIRLRGLTATETAYNPWKPPIDSDWFFV
jgi:hypothetical protein